METSSTFLLCWQTLTASFVLVFVEYFLVLRHVFVWSGNLESASQQCVDSMKRDRYPWDSLFPVTYRGSASFIVCSTTWRKSWTDQTTTSCRSSRVSTNIPCPSSTNTVTSSRRTFTMYARFHTLKALAIWSSSLCCYFFCRSSLLSRLIWSNCRPFLKM